MSSAKEPLGCVALPRAALLFASLAVVLSGCGLGLGPMRLIATTDTTPLETKAPVIERVVALGVSKKSCGAFSYAPTVDGVVRNLIKEVGKGGNAMANVNVGLYRYWVLITNIRCVRLTGDIVEISLAASESGLSPEIEGLIRAKCEREWPSEPRLREACIAKETDAYLSVR